MVSLRSPWTRAEAPSARLGSGSPRQTSVCRRKAAASSEVRWTQPKTPWGDPDLQGTWTSDDCIGTPMNRPANLGEKAYYTEQELAQRQSQLQKQQQNMTRISRTLRARITRIDRGALFTFAKACCCGHPFTRLLLALLVVADRDMLSPRLPPELVCGRLRLHVP